MFTAGLEDRAFWEGVRHRDGPIRVGLADSMVVVVEVPRMGFMIPAAGQMAL
mgnify:CR=1 FL=1